MNAITPYYTNDTTTLYHADTIELLAQMQHKSVDVIFADPPYFLSNDGISCSSGKMVSVNKGEWDKINSVEQKHEFNLSWIHHAYAVLKDSGTIWISGTMHNIYSVGMALEQCGFQIINNITWQKSNPPPNLACKTFTHSTETILWAKKRGQSKYVFNYKHMKENNNNKQVKDVWTSATTPQSEKSHGKHPTQKPEYLLKMILTSSTLENSLVLDPFCGSGTTGVVSKKLSRRFIGIDINIEFIELTKRRIEAVL
jgi:site-specific DNA-methyltransferase (adenine-specific)